MRRQLLLVLTLITIAPVARVEAQRDPRTQAVPTSSRIDRRSIDEAMRDELKRQQIVGMAVGLIVDNRIVYLNGFGMEDRANKIAVTRDTMFRWASISKPVTAVAAWQLWEQGKLDLDADVRTYVPEFSEKEYEVTPRQLLCHQGGIVHYRNGKVIRAKASYDLEHPFENVILALDAFHKSPLVAKPGEKFSYSTHGYILLSAAVERAGKKKFAEQVRDRICKPLGLETLQPDYQWKAIPHRSKGYLKLAGVTVEASNTDVSWKLGGGGFISNIDDLAKFTVGLMKNRLVAERTTALITTPQPTASGKPTPVGCGLFVDGSGRNLRIAHSGSQEKTRTRMVYYPNRGLGAVVMCNTHHAEPGDVTTKLLATVRD